MEALLVKGRGQTNPLVDLIPDSTVQEMLMLREGDQIYTAMAIQEVLSHWRRTNKTQAQSVDSHFMSLIDFYHEDEHLGLRHLRDILHEDNSAKPLVGLKHLEIALESCNIHARIAAVRNITRFASSHPGTTLELMKTAWLLNQKHEFRNVRRPLAREGAVEFIVSRLKDKKDGGAARDFLEDLLLYDPDDLIAPTVFDKAELIADDDPQYVKWICNVILKSEAAPQLKMRAKSVLDHGGR